MSKPTQPSLASLAFNGDDALTFCQAQMASNLQDLEPGRWQWSALLSAQGRVQALGILAVLSQQSVLLLLPAERADALHTHLQRYIFRSRVQISRTDMVFGFRLQSQPAPLTPGSCAADSSVLSGCIHALDGAALDLVWPIDQDLSMPTSQAIHLLARAGVPWVDDALVDRYTGHMLGLHSFGAISVSKGCYPGQEIVARTHYLGKSARHLRRIWCKEDLSTERFSKLTRTPVSGSGEIEIVGELIQWSPSEDSDAGLGLAVVKQDTGTRAWLQSTLIAVDLDAAEVDPGPCSRRSTGAET